MQNGNTPLHSACEVGQLAVAEMLIVAGAATTIKNKVVAVQLLVVKWSKLLLVYVEETIAIRNIQAGMRWFGGG